MASAEGSTGGWRQGAGSTSIRRVAEAWWVGERGRLHGGGKLGPLSSILSPLWTLPKTFISTILHLSSSPWALDSLTIC